MQLIYQLIGFGIRHVYEAHTPRMIRDGIPVMNGRTYTEGVMVEVLADGQFGYYGTPDISSGGIAKAAKSAFLQAKLASKYSIFKFDPSARPKHVGSYQSPYIKDRLSLSPKS